MAVNPAHGETRPSAVGAISRGPSQGESMVVGVGGKAEVHAQGHLHGSVLLLVRKEPDALCCTVVMLS
jgi:hypothetical protein